MLTYTTKLQKLKHSEHNQCCCFSLHPFEDFCPCEGTRVPILLSTLHWLISSLTDSHISLLIDLNKLRLSLASIQKHQSHCHVFQDSRKRGRQNFGWNSPVISTLILDEKHISITPHPTLPRTPSPTSLISILSLFWCPNSNQLVRARWMCVWHGTIVRI